MHVLAYVAACTKSGLPLRAAWHLQMQLEPRAQTSRTGVSFRRIVWPFFETYWRRQLRVRRFAFRSPDHTARQFEMAVTAGEDVSLERVLRALQFGV